MSTLWIRGGKPLRGSVVAPPDKSISHRALILAALNDGPCRVFPLSDGADNRSTLKALRQLGVEIVLEDGEPRSALVFGLGSPRRFSVPKEAIDCENSGTTMRFLAGLLSAGPGRVTLTGDASLTLRPMARLLVLERMGARLLGERGGKGELFPPITVQPAAKLEGQEFHLPIASAQVKSALLLAGLYAGGQTVVYEPERSRDHTERMLQALHVPIRIQDDGGIRLWPLRAPWKCEAIEVPPDLSSAAFILAAALLLRSEAVEVKALINPSRAGFLRALEGFGAELSIDKQGRCGGEEVAKISVRGKKEGLSATRIAGRLTLEAIDEIPLLSVVACFARGKTEIRDARELRVKESDRLAMCARLIRSFGGRVQEVEDGLDVDGQPEALHPAEFAAGLDHRIALSAAVFGLALPGCTGVHGAEMIGVSYPGFVDQIRALGGELDEEDGSEVPDRVR